MSEDYAKTWYNKAAKLIKGERKVSMKRVRPVTLTMPPEDVEILDELASRWSLCRSGFIRMVVRTLEQGLPVKPLYRQQNYDE